MSNVIYKPLASTHVALLRKLFEARAEVDGEAGVVVTQHIPHVLHNRVPARRKDYLVWCAYVGR